MGRGGRGETKTPKKLTISFIYQCHLPTEALDLFKLDIGMNMQGLVPWQNPIYTTQRRYPIDPALKS